MTRQRLTLCLLISSVVVSVLLLAVVAFSAQRQAEVSDMDRTSQQTDFNYTGDAHGLAATVFAYLGGEPTLTWAKEAFGHALVQSENKR